MVAKNDVLPDRPRLYSGCCIFDTDNGLVIRSVAGAFRIEPLHRKAMKRILARLDGTHNFSQLLGSECKEDAFYALRMLAWFAQSGMLVDGPISSKKPPSKLYGAPSLNGITLVILHNGLFAAALAERFEALGATVRHGDLAFARTCGAVAVACPDGFDPAALETANLRARALGVGWLPIFPFGDGIITGPLFRPLESPCFRCFERRWLGISPSISLELAYFAHLRNGAFQDGAVMTEEDAVGLGTLVGSGAARMLAGCAPPRRVTLTRPENGTTTQGTLEPCPQCEVCAGALASSTDHSTALSEMIWVAPPVPLGELAQKLEQLAATPCGLVSISPPPKHVKSALPGPLEVAVARFAIPEPEGVDGPQDNWCHGTALDSADARTLAIIEALERYNGLSPPSRGIWASYASIVADAVLPTQLPLFSEAQYARPGFPFKPFDPEQPVRWNWGYNLTQKRPVLVPTSAAWYGYNDTLLGESSNGVAAHSSRGHALLNGVLELIERDAFMIHWFYRLSPPKVDLNRVADDRIHAIINSVQKSEYAVHILDLTTDLQIPVVLALGVHEDRRKPALIVGAGASLEHQAALLRALSELYAATFSPTQLWTLRPALHPSEICNLADHSRAYEHPDWLQHASFLWASDQFIAWPMLRQPRRDWIENLAATTHQLEEHSHDIVGIDITGSDIARHGLFVVRAIVPGLVPLAVSTGGRLGGRRLYEAPVRMGYRDASAREGDLNPIPHCFP